jgi:hypothetical protein
MESSMYILGFELNIYFVIVVAAAVFVTTAILGMVNYMQNRKPGANGKKTGKKNKNKDLLRQSSLIEDTGGKMPSQPVPAAIAAQSADLSRDSDRKNNSGTVADKSATMPQPTISSQPAASSTAQDTGTAGKPENNQAEMPSSQENATIGNMKIEANTNSEPDAQQKEIIQIEELDKDTDDDNLLNLFDDDIVEDSAVTDLAVRLSDINLDTINKLSEELSQVLLKPGYISKRSHEHD